MTCGGRTTIVSGFLMSKSNWSRWRRPNSFNRSRSVTRGQGQSLDGDFICIHNYSFDYCRGGNLGRDWVDGPPKFEVGERPMHSPPPNILRSSVVGCARKCEKSKKGVFIVRKGSYTTSNKVTIRKIRETRGK